MMVVPFVLATLFTVLLGAAPAGAAPESTTPGKTSVFARETAPLGGGGVMTPLVGQILKGKKKQVLRVDATLTTESDVLGAEIQFTIVANGNTLGTAVGHCDAPTTVSCSVSGSFWLDLDAAETAVPGSVIGVPVIISMTGGSTSALDVGELYAATFSAQLVKK